jgi:hypothetical protein
MPQRFLRSFQPEYQCQMIELMPRTGCIGTFLLRSVMPKSELKLNAEERHELEACVRSRACPADNPRRKRLMLMLDADQSYWPIDAESVEEFSKFIGSAAAGKGDAYFFRSVTNCRLGRNDAARHDLERLLAMDPGNGHTALARTLLIDVSGRATPEGATCE